MAETRPPLRPDRESTTYLRFLRILFGLRMVMLAGSAGSFLGSLLMFWQGFRYIGDAWNILVAPAAEHGAAIVEHGSVTVPILESIDSFLFGIVLVIFAYGIAVGFVFRIPRRIAYLLPAWMKIEGVGQLKQILAEVVIVVLIVIFARVVVEAGNQFDWNILILPVAVILISGALWFLDLEEPHGSDDEATDNSPDTKSDH